MDTMAISNELGEGSEGQLVAEFARLLAANFASDVPQKSEEDAKTSHDLHEPESIDPAMKIEPVDDALGTETRPAEGRSLTAPANNRKGPRLASSRFRGCTRHRRTKRYEAHIWDQRQQRYLGGFDKEADAGRAHDVMALKCRTSNDNPQLNFPMENYSELLPYIDRLPKEEVVAQLRQLNRTAPRPKPRKPPAKPRSNTNLAGLTTRSGGIAKLHSNHRGGELGLDSPMTISEDALASFCRNERLTPVKLAKDPAGLKSAYHGQFLKQRPPSHPVLSAFANQKDVPLPPQWGHSPGSLDRTISPDFLEPLAQLTDSDLLTDVNGGYLSPPKFTSSMHSGPLRSPRANTYVSPGPLYVGRTLTSPRQTGWPAKDGSLGGALHSHAHSLPEPLPSSYELPSVLLSPTVGHTPAGESYFPPSYSPAPRGAMSSPKLQTLLSERSFSLSGNSMRQSTESTLTQHVHTADLPTTKHLPTPRAVTWDAALQGGEGNRTPRENQSFMRGSREGGFRYEGELKPSRVGSYQMSYSRSPKAASGGGGQTAYHSPGLGPSFEPEFGSGSRIPQLSPSGQTGYFGLGSGSAAGGGNGQGRRWERPLYGSADLGGGSGQDGSLSRAKCDDIYGTGEGAGLSFTQMLNQELPASEHLEASMLDAMDQWAP